MKGNDLDFSFSGLKTAVLRWVEGTSLLRKSRTPRVVGNPRAASVEEWRAVTPQATLDLIASFQRTVITELLRRVHVSADETGAESIIVSGGVACKSGCVWKRSVIPDTNFISHPLPFDR